MVEPFIQSSYNNEEPMFHQALNTLVSNNMKILRLILILQQNTMNNQCYLQPFTLNP